MSHISVFGFDVAEASQIRRIRAIRALGHDVTSYTMRRRHMNGGFRPDWDNIHLYETVDNDLKRRAMVILGSIGKMWRHRRAVAGADVVLARNLDMLIIAWAALLMARRLGRTPLVYECLDINGALAAPSAKGRAMRTIERFFLRRVTLLAVSSPAFVERYFKPVQGYDGAWKLIENKLAQEPPPPPRPTARRVPDRPLVLGWVGTIRCAPSLRILADTARALGPELRIEIHGVIHHHALPGFETILAETPGMSYHGPYRYPDGLAGVYARCDLVWAQDLWQRGDNSDWLLPNRIYEASWFGCPSIALADTETGRRIRRDGLGFVLPEASGAALAGLLRDLPAASIARCANRLLTRPDQDFRQTPEEVSAILPTSGPDAPRPAAVYDPV